MLVRLEKCGEVIDMDRSIVKRPPARFELVLCRRDASGNKLPERFEAYRGDNPRAAEAVLLKTMSKDEKKGDIYAIETED